VRNTDIPQPSAANPSSLRAADTVDTSPEDLSSYFAAGGGTSVASVETVDSAAPQAAPASFGDFSSSLLQATMGGATHNLRLCRLHARYKVLLTGGLAMQVVYLIMHYILRHYILIHYILIHYILIHYILMHYILIHYILIHYILTYTTYSYTTYSYTTWRCSRGAPSTYGRFV
jgi:hypothetical protein